MAFHDDDLRKLPRPELPREIDERVHRVAHAAFERAHGGTRGVEGLRRFGRVGVPLVLAGTAAIYLTWAIQTASALYR